MRVRHKLLFSTASLVAVVLGGVAQAEEASAQGGQVGEVVVTAQRRAERLKDVPMSITALSAEALQRAGVNSTQDLARVTPSVTMPLYGAFLQPSVRGVSSAGANLGDSSNVALYIDGVYQPQQIASLVDLPDVQQVEVLKGPQGALYGQNATGGAILVTSRSPSFAPSGDLSASYGNYNATDLRAFVTGPLLGDKIAGSLAAGFQQRDGFRHQVITGQRDFGLNSKVARAKVLVEPVNWAKVTVTGYYSDRKDSAPYAGIALNGNSAGYAIFSTAPRATSPNQFTTDPDVFTRNESYGASLVGQFEVGEGVLKTTTSLSRNKTTYLADIEYSPANLARYLTPDLKAHYFMQDANYVSKKLFDRLVILAGAFYLDGEDVFNPSTTLITVPTLVPAPYSPILLPGSAQQFGTLGKKVWAVYGDLTFDVTDKLVVTAGGRYTEETQRAKSGNFQYPTLPFPGGILDDPAGPQTWSKFTPRVTVRYALTSASNVYATWGKGFKSGVINTLDFSSVNPERITSYEIGYKGRPLANLTVNVAAFFYNYKDLQVAVADPPAYFTQNAASARLKGVDMDAAWAVTPELTISGSLSYLDAKYRSFPDATLFLPNGFGGNNVAAVDVSGQRMARAPKWTANLAANYGHDMELGRLTAYGSIYYNDGSAFEPSNRLKTGTYTTLDTEIGFEPVRVPGLRLVAWGRNLTNKAYLASFLETQLADGVSYAPPRTYGVRAEYKF
jgi:iron complex outermembrane receptor protein